jgi:hypothetical protein
LGHYDISNHAGRCAALLTYLLVCSTFCSLQIFHEPTQAEQTAKVPKTMLEPARTILVQRSELSDEAAATAASIVDAAVNSPTKDHSDEVETEAILVSDPTVGAYESDGQGETISI